MINSLMKPDVAAQHIKSYFYVLFRTLCYINVIKNAMFSRYSVDWINQKRSNLVDDDFFFLM